MLSDYNSQSSQFSLFPMLFISEATIKFKLQNFGVVYSSHYHTFQSPYYILSEEMHPKTQHVLLGPPSVSGYHRIACLVVFPSLFNELCVEGLFPLHPFPSFK